MGSPKVKMRVDRGSKRWVQVVNLNPRIRHNIGRENSGIEILNASEKVDLKTILSYTLELDKELLSHKTA